MVVSCPIERPPARRGRRMAHATPLRPARGDPLFAIFSAQVERGNGMVARGMDIVSSGPHLPVAPLVWQRGADLSLAVLCKATFRLTPGEATLAKEQEGINEEDNHWDDNPSRSLYSASDLVPFKARADVLVVGHAFAPRRTPVRTLVARLAVAGIDKAIEIRCDRAWSAMDGIIREGAPFASMPLRYERAAGGPSTWNPVGVRADGPPDASGYISLPNLEPQGSRQGARIEPTGFGPIAPSWPPRAGKLGPGAPGFSVSRQGLSQIPPGLDPAFFNVAPVDQQVAEIAGDEALVLEGLHPEHARLVTRLPGLGARASVERAGRPAEDIALACDTLWIDTDLGIATLTWRGQVRLAHAGEPGRVVVRLEPIRRADRARSMPDSGEASRVSRAPAPARDTVALPLSSIGAVSNLRSAVAADPAVGPASARKSTVPLDPAQALAVASSAPLPFHSPSPSSPSSPSSPRSFVSGPCRASV